MRKVNKVPLAIRAATQPGKILIQVHKQVLFTATHSGKSTGISPGIDVVSIYANADGQRNSASRKNNAYCAHNEYNYHSNERRLVANCCTDRQLSVISTCINLHYT